MKHGRDYATFHYAVKALKFGQYPYKTEELSKLARKEGTRRNVHPFFYPPPSLLAFGWSLPLTLQQGYLALFVLNHLCVFGLFWLFMRNLSLEPLLLGVLFVGFSPLLDCIVMGQVNIGILLLISVAIFQRRGSFLSAAAMIKMSPAILLIPFGIWKKWTFVLTAISFSIIFSIFSLPIMVVEEQITFYREVLPQFSSGSYSGLRVPINLPSNHSIPDIWNQLWPGENQRKLSSNAQQYSFLTTFFLLGVLSYFSWKGKRQESKMYMLGAFISLMVLTPVYTYEHHLVFMLLPIVLVAQRWKSFPFFGRAILLVGYFFIAWPLSWLRDAQEFFPQLHWIIQESKFLSSVLIGMLCIYCSLESAKCNSAFSSAEREE
ncbi:MAG: glycosyltransferase family 87 protein [Myxococcota bacterium]|nr:glycosyltransferase family 87 protein [Myxococcota bacterium]